METSGTEPVIGILGWEDRANREIYGSLAAPGVFSFPVEYRHIKGACYETIIENPSIEVLGNMIEAARAMEAAGVKAITTSCGFNAIFQRELADSVGIPVFASALLQVPMVHRMLNSAKNIGVIVANSDRMSVDHLSKAGISSSIHLRIAGLQYSDAFSTICACMPGRADVERLRSDVTDAARKLVEEDGNIGAIVLEMTILHAFSDDIRKAVKLPVFDIVTLANYVYGCLWRFG